MSCFWLGLCIIFTIPLTLNMLVQYNQSILETITAIMIVGAIGTTPFAIIKYVKKNMEKNLHGQIQ